MLQERKKKAKQAKERRDSGKKGKDKTPEPEWPPRRKHHKAPPSPRSKYVTPVGYSHRVSHA